MSRQLLIRAINQDEQVNGGQYSVLASVPASKPSVISIDFQGLFKQYLNGQGLILLLVLGSLFLFSRSGGKGKLTSARFCGKDELMQATDLAMKHTKNKKCQPVTLWAGTPRYWLKWTSFSAKLQTFLWQPPTVFFPHAERGLLVMGAPGSGKTFSAIDRIIESAFQQGHSVLIYDKKGDQVQLHSALATRYGYSVQVFAPGYSYSARINPLDFVDSPQDTTMAGEIGKIIVSSNRSGDGKGNDFFEMAGEMLARGLVQLAKTSPYQDLAMVYAFIQLPNFVQRIYHAVHRPDEKKMDPWIAPSFSQLLSSKDAEKTVAGIKATAEAVYSAFIQKDLLLAFIGKSTIDVKLTGKQVIFFQLDDERRTVLSPLIAVAIHLCIVKNLSKKRDNPFCYFLDEFPSLGKLDRIVNFVNEYRSNGGVPVIGIQSLEQLYDQYGDKRGNAIASALSTHILFNPGNTETAEKYSKRYGEKEVLLRNRSTGNSTGGNQTSRSVNWSEQIHKRPLLSVDEIMRFPQGECVITSPAYGSGREALFPYKLKIPVSGSDIKRACDSEALWPNIRQQLEERVLQQAKQEGFDLENLHNEITKRIEMAYSMLPLPSEEGQSEQQGQTSGSAREIDKERIAKIAAQGIVQLKQ